MRIPLLLWTLLLTAAAGFGVARMWREVETDARQAHTLASIPLVEEAGWQDEGNFHAIADNGGFIPSETRHRLTPAKTAGLLLQQLSLLDPDGARAWLRACRRSTAPPPPNRRRSARPPMSSPAAGPAATPLMIPPPPSPSAGNGWPTRT